MRATEKMTDHIIFGMMTSAGLNPEPESTQIVEVQNALRTASKRWMKQDLLRKSCYS